MKNFIKVICCLLFLNINAQVKTINYNDGNQQLEGLIAGNKKSAKKKGGVLILPAWMGIDNNAKENAEAIAKLGYVAFVADIYGVDKRPTNTKEAAQSSGSFKNDIKLYQKRIQLALDQLLSTGVDPNKIAVIGYCFGGTGAIEAARTNMNVRGVVSFHGGLGRDAARSIEKINPKVLVLHGAIDPYVSEAELKAFQSEMNISKSDWQMVYYADAVHSFTHKDAGNDNSKGAAYNEKAAMRSWMAMRNFFSEILQ